MRTHPSATAASPSAPLPWSALLALLLASFAATANETVPAGLLPELAEGFGVSESWAGQLVTLCALGAGIGAIPLSTWLRQWPRRRVLLAALVCFALGNAVTALSDSYVLALAARLVIGLATGLAWSEIGALSRRIVTPTQQGRALSVAMLGIPLALAAGVPLATWLGHLTSWRWVFLGLSLIALLLLAWLRISVPDIPPLAERERAPVRKVLVIPGVRPVLAVVLLWVLSHYALYTYVSPFLASVGQESHLGTVLLLFGLSMLAGLWLSGYWIDRHLRTLALGSLCLFVFITLVWGLRGSSWHVVATTAVLWGLSFSGAPSLLQTALADAAGEHEAVALSLLVTVFNLAFAGSGVLGGILLATTGARHMPLVLALLAAVACATVWRAHRHGFPSQRLAQARTAAT